MERRWHKRGILMLLLALLAGSNLLRAQDNAPEPAELDFQILGGEQTQGEEPAAEEPAVEETSPAEEPADAAHGDATHGDTAHGEEAHGAAAAGHGEAHGGGHGDDHGGGGGGGHADPVSPILLALVLMLLAAKIGGAVFAKFNQPAVLGELVVGVILGNLLLPFGATMQEASNMQGFMGWLGRMEVYQILQHGCPIDIIARIGVILLLFMVGLESNLQDMLKVGWSSLLAAILGIAAPFFLGFIVSLKFLPGEHDILLHVFIGATLCATSVGITARVLQELNRLHQDESRIILGAAVIDDILGLVILAVVAGVISAKNTGGEMAAMSVVLILVKAIVFLVVAVLGGQWLSPKLFRLASKMQADGMLLITALMICFALSYLANLIGLAPIVGAFAAGLLLDEVHFADFRARGHDHHLEELIHPIAQLMVPIFFVQMGMTVNLKTFANVEVLGFAALLTVVAILGKQMCALGVLGKGMDKMSVGIGMVPRGEVGLIFASIGQSLWLGGEPVVGPNANTAIVIMVIVTTMVTPPVLKWSLERGDKKKAAYLAEHPEAAASAAGQEVPPPD